ncbi:MAG: beta-ketoacyl-ACP synthase III [Dehalobacterium sp.]
MDKSRRRSRSIKIMGTGSYTPERILTNQELEERGISTNEWILKNIGIRERRIALKGQTTSDLATEAARRAMEDAGLSAGDIDLIIVATTTPDRPCPSTACIVQKKIGAFQAAAFDISAVCAGFIYGFSLAAGLITSGGYKNILVIGADTFSRITDWKKRDCVFFGDGAGAAVLTSCKKGEGLLSCYLGADGSGYDDFTVRAGGSEEPATMETVQNRRHYFSMNGRAVFEAATKVIPLGIRRVLEDTGLGVSDIDWVIPHQPNINILKVCAEKLGLPFEKVMVNLDKYANTSGGTIPILLDETLKSGKIKKGDIVVLAGVGAGWTWGTAIIKWV